MAQWLMPAKPASLSSSPSTHLTTDAKGAHTSQVCLHCQKSPLFLSVSPLPLPQLSFSFSNKLIKKNSVLETDDEVMGRRSLMHSAW